MVVSNVDFEYRMKCKNNKHYTCSMQQPLILLSLCF